MLTILRDPVGRIELVCEWWCVDQAGMWHPEGKFVFVNQLEVSPGVKMQRMIKPIIRHIAEMAPNAIGAFWNRAHDGQNPRTHAFRRDQFVALKREVVNG